LGFIYPGFVVKNIAKRLGKPLIYHARGNLHPNRMRLGAFKKYLYFFIFERSILDYASFVIALNEVEEKVISRIVSQSKVRIIPNGIDCYGDESKMTNRKVEDETFQLLYLGRLDTSKGIELLIHALKILNDQDFNKNFHLNIAGTGDNDYQTSLKDLANELGVYESISFYGHIHGQQKVDLISLSHLFVLPSEAEGLSIAILEAFADNLPVLITKECGFEDEVNNKAGRYCKRDAKDIAEQIFEITNNYNLYASSFAFQLSIKKYSWDKIGLDMLEAYDAAINTNII
jgi:poly(glycerol-phosphate) alpha-glucosyltransferase